MPLTLTRIPERYRRGLAKINTLPIETVTDVASVLGEASLTSRKERIAAVERAARLNIEDAEAIITSLQSLYVLRASAELPVEELVSVLIRVMQASGVEGLAVSDEDKAAVITKLTTLLSLKTLERAAKIEQLKADNQSIFYDAKILTDLRPVFDQPREPPIGFILTNMLKIVYHEFGEHKELLRLTT